MGRWRQIINGVDRIRIKHLLTLQEGVSRKDNSEKWEAGGPTLSCRPPFTTLYLGTARPHPTCLESFIGEIQIAASRQYILAF